MAVVMTSETWKTIPGFEQYEVSDLGNVRTYRDKQGHWKGVARLLSPLKDKHGYLFVKLGRGNMRKIHHLVLDTFAGTRPADTECRHLDGNRSNNRLHNLQWGTRSENYQDRKRHGTDNEGRITRRAVLTRDEVLEIRTSSESRNSLAERFGVCKETITRVRSGKTWNNLR